MTTRADRIESVLRDMGARARIAAVARTLSELEGTDVHQNAVSATVLQDNRTRDGQGRAPRFSTSGDGSVDRGWIALRDSATLGDGLAIERPASIPELIERENTGVRRQLQDAIRALTWREFESNFLLLILEALGFHNIQITQATRDNGVDAYCTYQRGIVMSSTIVSAKHWQNSNVASDEIQRLRGIKGEADTGVIVTSSSFSPAAVLEAQPSQNQRSIVLVDGELLVSTCLGAGIGVRQVNLPASFRFVGLAASDEE